MREYVRRPAAQRPNTGGRTRASRLVADGGALDADRILRLQQLAGNRSVRTLVQRTAPAVGQNLHVLREAAAPPVPTAPPPAVPAPPRVDLVFLLGDPKADSFYREARGFYQQTMPKAAVHEVGSLAATLKIVKSSSNPIGRLVIVSHAHEDGTLMFKLDANDPDNRLTYTEMREANLAGGMPAVDTKIVDEQTAVEIRGCNIGRSPLMLNEIDKSFGGKARVTAPTHEQRYAHDVSGYREDFSGYFIERPGKVTMSDAELKPLFTAKYPFVGDAQWDALIAKKKTIQDQQGPFEIEVAQPKPADALSVFTPALESELPKSEGWSFTYVKRTDNPPGFDYTFEAFRLDSDGKPEKRRVAIPFSRPSAKELEQVARQELSRPDAYAYTTVKTVQDAPSSTLRFQLFPERSEWVVKHTVIQDASGPHEPSPNDPMWWGESNYTP